jgi:hypothetical protein
MAKAIITQIKSTGTTYRVGRTANMVLTNLQGQLIKKSLVTKAIIANNKKRGSFLAFSKKSYTGSF